MAARILLVLVLALFAALPCRGEDPASRMSQTYDFTELPPAIPQAPTAANETQQIEIYKVQWSNYQEQLKEYNRHRELRFDMEIKEVAMLCGLTIAGLLIVLGYLRRTPGFRAEHAVHAAGFIFIIQGTLTLVMMAETEQQLAAASGILGAVAGYLFGSLRRPAPAAGGDDTEAAPSRSHRASNG